MVGQKLVVFPGIGVFLTYPAKAQGLPPAMGHFDDVIRSYSSFAVHRAALNQCIHSVFLEAGDKKQAFGAEQAKPSIVDVPFVKGNDGTLW